MSCKQCEEFQYGNRTTYFRWKNANIEVRGCKKHLVEVFEALSYVQKLVETGVATKKNIKECSI